ncbi:hypothetical protein BB559_000743 [Furculomyces boomerangus]|uniref:GDP-mannose transporter n=2 Tax=Harpellales TaxID=61421 RepID=A0A2T9Z492_9FUNG|nr:hypothetical protein BB559_000743 [Furculomyces boomerangus]PWA01165.1 hypothetical protein BB558_002745 [Smittium angustum]
MLEQLRSAIPIIAYCASSITMTLTNKLVLSGFKFKMAFLVLAIQSLGSVLLLFLASKIGGDIKFRPLNKKDVNRWMPVAILQVCMLYTGAKALQYLNVPLFTVFKNLTIIAVAYGERLVFKTAVTRMMMVSFLLMVLSSIVGAANDITFNFYGYFWMGCNCFASASFVVIMRKTITVIKFRDFDTVYYNNILTLGIFLIMSFLTEPWSNFTAYYMHEDNKAEMLSFVYSNIVSGISGFAISYTSAWCLRTTSSTTYSMVGALNKLPIAIFAMVFFSDPVTFGGVMAVVLGFAAGIVYTNAKNQVKREQPLGTQVLPPPVSSNTSEDNNAFISKLEK